MRTLLSMFDYTGAWAEPFETNGWNVIQVDLKHGTDVAQFSCEWIMENFLDGCGTVDGIIAAPPCTDFSYSGAQYWPAKDADGRTAASVHLVLQTVRTVEFLKPDFWALENPRGRIEKLAPQIGPCQFTFDPCDFAGWLGDSKDRADTLRHKAPGRLTARDVAFIKERNLYTKRTHLWGMFNPPEKLRIEPIRCTQQGSWLQSLGGKGARTKAQRSITPEGFARAFYEANWNGRLDWEAIDEGRAEYPWPGHPQLDLQLA